MDRLNEWFSIYKDIEQIKFSDAQKLSKQAREETDPKKQKELYDRLIMGTMYVVYNYIVNNKLYLLVNQDFDMDDLLSSFTRQWITIMKNGTFDKENSFASVMQKNRFIQSSLRGFSDDKRSDERMPGVPIVNHLISNEDLKRCIDAYIDAINKNNVCRVEDLVPFVGIWIYPDGYHPSILAAMVIETLDELREQGWEEKLHIHGNLTKDNLEVIQNALWEKQKSNEGLLSKEDLDDEKEFADLMNDSFYRQTVKDVVDKLQDKEKDIIIKRYGLDGNRPMSYAELGRLYNYTRERIRQIESKAFHKMRRFISSNITFNKNNKTIRRNLSLYDIKNLGIGLNPDEWRYLQENLTPIEYEVAERLYESYKPQTVEKITKELHMDLRTYFRISEKIDRLLKFKARSVVISDTPSTATGALEQYKVSIFEDVDTPGTPKK